MIKFIYTHDYKEQAKHNLVLETSHEITLTELLQKFDAFLKGVGFVYKGQVCIDEGDDE